MLIRLAVLLFLTIGSTLINGHLTNRWSLPADFQQNNAIVLSIPKQMGVWNYVEDANPLPDGVIDELGVTEYISRVYSDGTNTVTLLLMAGRTGRLIRHSPEICYGAIGNTFLQGPTQVTLDVDGKTHEFRVLPISASSNLTGDFAVVYGYANGGAFLSPANPRMTYHGQPSVEKIQVLCTLDQDKLGEIPEYAKPFLEEVCRYIQKAQGVKKGVRNQ